MAWSIELDPRAKRELDRLDPQVARRINRVLFERIAFLENPRSIGEALTGSKLGNYWKYRVGNYRIIADIQDARLCVQVVRLGNRREVYR